MVSSFDLTRGPGELPEDPTSSLRPPSRGISSAAAAFLAQAPLHGASENAFVLRRSVGEGSFGEVWEALQITLNRVVAVKRPREGGEPSSTAEGQQHAQLEFYKEALVTARLDHPNIVPVYELGKDKDGRPLLAMKLVKGTVWSDLIRDDFGLSISERLSVHLPTLILVSQAVAFAHSRGIVHRDLKPSQVMVGRFGEVFLMDWGLAVSIEPPTADSAGPPVLATPVAEAPNPAGTVAYMAPEQTDNTSERISERTDIFLLGGILYYLLTKTYPHPQQSSLEAFQHAARGIIEPPQERTTETLPEELVSICTRAMARQPEERYAGALEFVEALQGYLSGTGKRDESRRLTSSAVALIKDAGGDYQKLEKADQLLVQARGEWADNPDAVEAHQHVLADFAYAAIHRRDLKLAEAQAERIEDDQKRADLLREVRLAASRLQREARQRKVAIAAAFGLTIAAVAMGLVSVSQHNKVREERAQARTHIATTLAETKMREANSQREREQAQLFERISDTLVRTAAFADRAEQEVPFPTSIEFNRDWSPMYLRSKTELASQIKRSRADLEKRRQALLAENVDLPSHPFRVLIADAILSLNEAGNSTDTLKAYSHFQEAARAEPDRIEALVGMAIAAGRAKQYTSATEALRQARGLLGGRTGWPFDYVLQLQREIGQIRAASFRSHPDDVIIEAWQGGKNNDMYRETSGTWTVVEGGWSNKSAAPGLTTGTSTGSRRFHFYAPLSRINASPYAIARFSPKFKRPGKYHVYVTWPDQASAQPVRYAIRHASGEVELPLIQDGLNSNGGNGHLWVPLGEYSFNGSAEEYVEVRVGSDVRPLTPLRYGQAIVDAVYFAAEPLKEAMAEAPIYKNAKPWSAVDTGTTTPELQWQNNYNIAKEQAEKSGKKLLAFVFSPISSYYPHPLIRCRDYCNNRLFIDESVKAALREGYEIVSLNSAVETEKMKELGLVYPSTTIVINDGSTQTLKLTGDELLLSTEDFANLLRAKTSVRPAAE